jgi:NTE family protein
VKIALALSGGGHRAAAFHLGVLKYLAEHGLLERVTDISTTSGGSLLIAQLFHSTGGQLNWPDSQAFLQNSLPYCKHQITQQSLENSFIKRMFSPRNWSLFGNRANLMARSLKQLWSISKNMGHLPTQPSWVINGTANISGNRWFIEQKNQVYRMGCEDLGEQECSDFPIADAVAISAAYPGVIGPYRLKNHLWDLYLSDGGLYDNLSLEALYDVEARTLKPDLAASFLLVSDASKEIQHKPLAPVWRPLLRTLRLIDVINHQVRSLRLRTLLPELEANGELGQYLAIGTQYNSEVVNLPKAFRDYEFLSHEAVEQAKETRTSLACLSEAQFDILVRHGYETAMLQLHHLTQQQVLLAEMP